MINFRCTHCDKGLTVSDELAGKKARCPGCALVVVRARTSDPRVTNLVPVISSTPSKEGRSASNRGQATYNAPAKADNHPEPHQVLDQAGQESGIDAEPLTGPGGPGQEEHSEALVVPSLKPDAWQFLAPAQSSDEIGRLGTYRVLKVLGAGGMGIVFRAQDMLLERLVALKVMLPATRQQPVGEGTLLS